jgi:hypothetical protein
VALSVLAQSACGGAGPGPAARPRPAPRPLEVADLTRLLALSELRWLIRARPREIAAIPWLIVPIGSIASEASFARFASAVGFDLRQVLDAVVAHYESTGHETSATFYLVRHNGEPTAIARAFQDRVTTTVERAEDQHDVVRISGLIGTTPHTLVLLGRDVAGFQVGGSPTRGPARIASLYARNKLTRAATALSEPALVELLARFGPAPAVALARGPFEGELARGARGLLGGATAMGAATRPTSREGIGLALAIAGEFRASGEAASAELMAAWQDLASESFGRILGLDRPVEPPLVTHAPGAVALMLELDPRRLAQGLRDLTSARIEEIMRG